MSLELLSAASAGEVVPRYLLEPDYRWLSALIGEIARFEGRTRAELDERLKEPLSVAAPFAKLRLAKKVIVDHFGRIPSALPPKQVRRAVFGAAASTGPAEALAAAAADLGATALEISSALFADIPAQSRIAAPRTELTPQFAAMKCNLVLVASLMRRALEVRIVGEGNLRPLVRQAKLRGLLCAVSSPATRGGCTLEISGPFALFRHTTMYGRALGSLVPELGGCHRVELRARLELHHGATATLVIRSGDPILPPAPRREHDSAVERAFARDFGRAAPEWDIVREPAPLPAAGTLIFPDFLLRHRHRPERARWLEIVGFWTPQYLANKLGRLRAAAVPDLILCVDESLNCGDGDLPAGAELVRFRRRIAPEAVLAALARPAGVRA